MIAHTALGGSPCEVCIEALVETDVDTTVDAIECAAAIAAWLALGHAESDAVLEFADGKWSARFVTR